MKFKIKLQQWTISLCLVLLFIAPTLATACEWVGQPGFENSVKAFQTCERAKDPANVRCEIYIKWILQSWIQRLNDNEGRAAAVALKMLFNKVQIPVLKWVFNKHFGIFDFKSLVDGTSVLFYKQYDSYSPYGFDVLQRTEDFDLVKKTTEYLNAVEVDPTPLPAQPALRRL